MSNIDYSVLTDKELKRYFLEHRDDKEAFFAYMDRRHTKPQPVIIEAGELDELTFEEQIQVIEERLRVRFGL